jgi:hypothetical protein
MYLFIYLFSFYFFKKIIVFLIFSIMKITALPCPAPVCQIDCPYPCPCRPALPLPHVPKQIDPSFLET